MSQGYNAEQLRTLEEGWFFYDHSWTLLFEIIRKLEGDSVLDVGCGTGLALSVVQSVFPWRKCAGLDPSDAARDTWKARRINVELGSATAIPQPDLSWDTVYSSHVIEHIEDEKKAVSEIVRVAKRRAIIVVPDGNVDDKNFGTPHVHIYNRITLKRLMEDVVGAQDKLTVYSLPHTRMSNLIALVDKEAA